MFSKMYLNCLTQAAWLLYEHIGWGMNHWGVHVVILRLIHRLGVIRVPTEYRGSEAW